MKLLDATRQAEKRAETQVQEACSSICDQSRKAADTVRKQSRKAVHTVQDKSHAAVKKTRKQISRNPFAFVLGTFGVGLLLGKLMHWKRR